VRVKETSTHTPRSFLVLVGLVVVFASAALWFSWIQWPPVWGVEMAILLIAAALSDAFAFTLPGLTISVAYPLAMSAIIVGGPAAAGLVAAVSSGVILDVRNRRPVSIVLFNLSQGVLLACLGGWIYIALSNGKVLQTVGVTRLFVAGDFPAALWGMVGAAILVPIANLALTSLGVGLYQDRPLGSIFASAAGVLLPAQISLACVGFLMAQVLMVNAIALPLFVFPLAVARQLYQRYAGLKDAYADTVRSLVGALEAKDPYTRGHSERVSRYAVHLGQAMNLSPREIERLEYAALLHDIGKLGVSSAVLTKPGKLDDDEMQSIKDHPARGAAMVERIPPLRDLSNAVHQHHEWFDGNGYPDRVLGNAVSLSARILSVADSYDAMTTTRSYRPALSREAAVGELLRGAGSQFDAEIVRVFIEASTGMLEVRVPETDGVQQPVAPISVSTQG